MANTPYNDLGTQDILSAHISGLAHSINKIEKVLNMKTDTATITLNPVTDQQDTSLRYRIYEGSIRNWTEFTILRNNKVVDPAEYEAQGAFGVIVFHTQQKENDVVTAKITYIVDSSKRLETIENNVSINNKSIGTLETNVSGIKSDMSTINQTLSKHDTDIKNLQNEVAGLKGGGGSEGGSGGGIEIPLQYPPKEVFNIRPGINISQLTSSVNILMSAGKIDAFPIIIKRRTRFTRLKIVGGSGTPASNVILGIYNDVNNMPGELIAETNVFSIGAGNNIHSLKTPATLDPGIYWLARWSSNSVRIDGWEFDPNLLIYLPPISSAYMDGSGDISGIRTASQGTSLTTLPNPMPPVGNGSSDTKYLSRQYIGPTYALT